MEGCATDGSPPTGEDEEKFEHVKEADSATNFQRFVYDLFEKNGILTDLRAYLRGHIVNVLKSAQTGEPPTCQKHFTQRLELPCQALNMLIAEYLLRLEFSYSLSVFVSEIPLANMVFDFAKKLMISNQGDFENLTFKDSDVWSILNYLGVKCDSDHASRILELYNGKDNLPLLFCIMKCMPMYNKEPFCENQAISSSESVSSSAKSQDFDEEKHRSASRVCSHDRCRHYVFCKTCHAKMTRLREKYRTKKKHLIKTAKACNLNPLHVESLMRNIGVMERSLIEEMFQQLKNVYEAEMEMMKQEEEKKIKRSLASHALQLQRRQDEMEESFKARESELERSVQEKKKFLWGLARALRDQHATMARAMHAVRHETDRLTAKEDSLKSQLVEAEQVLRKRGEDMREQISSELIILEGHLESMKKERETISRERAELQTLKTACDLRGDDSGCVIKANDLNNDELRSHYDLLKNELSILKKYLETTKLQPKCVIERSTLTELSDVSSKIQIVLNNDQDVQRIPVKTESDERRTPNKVVNDLKKPKNVNFCTSNVEEVYHESGISRSRSRSSCSDAGDLLHHLRDENERLKTFARQQREHIDELTSHQARLQAELAAVCHRPEPRPRTAPAHMPREPILRLNTSASVSSVGWRKGAGEELSVFSNAQPRILLPGDTLPFIGVLRDRHSDNRRHLINQWRALRRRMSPVGGVSKRPLAPARDRSRERPGTAIPTVSVFPSSQNDEDAEDTPNPRLNETFTFTAVARERPKSAVTQRKLAETHQCREKSPKTVLREAKENLRNKTDVKDHPPSKAREKSPNAVLREAKLRLRKLEIEAEAVERSYLDFRRRHADKRPDTVNARQAKELIASIDLHKTSPYKLQENFRVGQTSHTASNHDRNIMKQDFHKYLCEYETKFDATASHFKGTGNASKPIPAVYSKIEGDFEAQRKDNYLETPLEEFRKLYTQKPTTPSEPANIHRTDSPSIRNTPETPLEEFRKIYTQKPTVPSVPVNFPQIEKESPRNTSEPPTAPEDRESPDSRKTRDVNKQDELEILKDNISKMYNLHKQDEKPTGGERSESPELKESIVIEVEHVSEANSLRVTGSEVGDLVLVVESSPDARAPGSEQISPHMTILVSPKAETPGDHDPSPDQASIFHASRKRRPSEADPAESLSDLDAIPDDYPDDFSADVDNYNSRSDYNDADHSPISLPKNSEDDNFWDS